MGERGGELMGATLQKSRCGKVGQVGHKTPCPTTPPLKGGGRWWGALGVPAEVGQRGCDTPNARIRHSSRKRSWQP
jgi:hypothetical protein